jgi:orotate phosphoribosyltransferase
MTPRRKKTPTGGIRRPAGEARMTGAISCAPMSARETLVEELRRHALVVGEVTLTSGATAQYYVDAKRAILRPAGFGALAELVADYARRWEATAVGGLTMGADAPACAALAGGAPVKAFFVRKETKGHGLQRRIEGPPLDPGERCLIVEDVVTTGGSTIQAIEAVRAEGYDVAGVVTVLDRLAGGAEAIARASRGAPYQALATIDDVYPDRPDRQDEPS